MIIRWACISYPPHVTASSWWHFLSMQSFFTVDNISGIWGNGMWRDNEQLPSPSLASTNRVNELIARTGCHVPPPLSQEQRDMYDEELYRWLQQSTATMVSAYIPGSRYLQQEW